MTLSMDKFGRILIPKKVRAALNLHPGSALSLELSEDSRRAYIEAEQPNEPKLRIDELGIPTVFFDTEETMKYDFVEAIRKDREHRGLSGEAE